MDSEQKHRALAAKLAAGETITEAEKIDLMRTVLYTCHGAWRMEMSPGLKGAILFLLDVTQPTPATPK